MTLLGRLLARVPHRWLLAAGAALGALLYALGVRRRVVLENLRLAFPEKTEAERVEIAKATYRNLAQMIPDFLRVPFLPREEVERMMVIEGWDAYLEARAKGRGVVACTAHYGNFDLLAAAMTLRGTPITMISRRMGASGANDLWRGIRERSGVEDLVVKRGETLRAATAALKRGRTLGYVIDQNEPGKAAIFPTFFGVPAATSPTPAYIARRSGAAVVFTVSRPLGDGRHEVVIEGPLEVPDTGDRQADVLAFMQELNDRLERWVRRDPARWYWLHRRWKRRGDAPAAAPGRIDAPGGAG
jgi:KDO2-lipid IV(A) lauroyltransferase